MPLETPLFRWNISGLLETALPDFILALTFFTSLSYAVLARQFTRQRPAVAMSVVIGLGLTIGLIVWEQKTGFSVLDLGPVAVGFALIVLAMVLHQAIRQIGGFWAGAGIALGVSILIAQLLQLRIPINAEFIETITIVALVVGLLSWSLHMRAHPLQGPISVPRRPEVPHDMNDLYRSRQLSKRLTHQMRDLHHQADTLHVRPQGAGSVLVQLRRMLPEEGYLTERLASLRAKAHRLRNGHIARLEETRHVFAKLPPSAAKKASAELVGEYQKIAGIDIRLERLDKAVAETERRILELTRRAQQQAREHDFRGLTDCLSAAGKLQHHNSRLLKLIKHSEDTLTAAAQKVAKQTQEVNGE